MKHRVSSASHKATQLADRVRTLLAATGSVRSLCALLNTYLRGRRIHENRVHTLLSGEVFRALNHDNFALIEKAVARAEGRRPDLVRAGRAAREAAKEKPVAEVTVRSEFVLKLTQEEVRLIGLGLAGKLKGKDIADALALNTRLLEQRMKYLADLADVTAGALEAARREAAEAAAGRPGRPTPLPRPRPDDRDEDPDDDREGEGPG